MTRGYECWCPCGQMFRAQGPDEKLCPACRSTSYVAAAAQLYVTCGTSYCTCAGCSWCGGERHEGDGFCGHCHRAAIMDAEEELKGR